MTPDKSDHLSFFTERDERGYSVWRWRSPYTVSEAFDTIEACVADARNHGMEVTPVNTRAFGSERPAVQLDPG